MAREPISSAALHILRSIVSFAGKSWDRLEFWTIKSSATPAATVASYPDLLRRITVRVEGDDPLILVTNLMHFAASTIVRIYKERWQIEVFFKTLKQNLKIKTFVGTTENALRIQIWTALIAILLLKWLHHLSKARWSLSNLASMLRLNLFTYRDLTEWLNNPFSTPPLSPVPEQLLLDLSGFGQPLHFST